MRYVKSGIVDRTGRGVSSRTSILSNEKRREKVWCRYLIIVEKLLGSTNSSKIPS